MTKLAFRLTSIETCRLKSVFWSKLAVVTVMFICISFVENKRSILRFHLQQLLQEQRVACLCSKHCSWTVVGDHRNLEVRKNGLREFRLCRRYQQVLGRENTSRLFCFYFRLVKIVQHDFWANHRAHQGNPKVTAKSSHYRPSTTALIRMRAHLWRDNVTAHSERFTFRLYLRATKLPITKYETTFCNKLNLLMMC